MIEKLKWLLPRLPLPMLALAASYGVYQFALLFVPWWVALVQAAAFETTYLGLAMIESETPDQRRRATAISIGAVVVSVLYNSLAGFFHRNGLGELSMVGEIVLATLHGAPLAIVAYLVADLLLHKGAQEQQGVATAAIESPKEEPATPPSPTPAQQAHSTLLEALKADSKPVTPEKKQKQASSKSKPASGITKRSRVRSALDEHGNLKDSELYELLPDISQSSIRVHASEWRKECLAAANGRH